MKVVRLLNVLVAFPLIDGKHDSLRGLEGEKSGRSVEELNEVPACNKLLCVNGECLDACPNGTIEAIAVEDRNLAVEGGIIDFNDIGVPKRLPLDYDGFDWSSNAKVQQEVSLESTYKPAFNAFWNDVGNSTYLFPDLGEGSKLSFGRSQPFTVVSLDMGSVACTRLLMNFTALDLDDQILGTQEVTIIESDTVSDIGKKQLVQLPDTFPKRIYKLEISSTLSTAPSTPSVCSSGRGIPDFLIDNIKFDTTPLVKCQDTHVYLEYEDESCMKTISVSDITSDSSTDAAILKIVGVNGQEYNGDTVDLEEGTHTLSVNATSASTGDEESCNVVVTVVAKDSDNDGLPDCRDECPESTFWVYHGVAVDLTGCSIDDKCPCHGTFKNKGQYQSCVVETFQQFTDAGFIEEVRRALVVCTAGHSECGP